MPDAPLTRAVAWFEPVKRTPRRHCLHTTFPSAKAQPPSAPAHVGRLPRQCRHPPARGWTGFAGNGHVGRSEGGIRGGSRGDGGGSGSCSAFGGGGEDSALYGRGARRRAAPARFRCLNLAQPRLSGAQRQLCLVMWWQNLAFGAACAAAGDATKAVARRRRAPGAAFRKPARWRRRHRRRLRRCRLGGLRGRLRGRLRGCIRLLGLV